MRFSQIFKHKGTYAYVAFGGLFLMALAVLIVQNRLRPVENSQSSTSFIPQTDGHQQTTYWYNDSTIKYDLELIAKALACQFSLRGSYPLDLHSFDAKCFAGRRAPQNPNTNMDYEYSVDNRNENYTLIAELSNGQRLIVTKNTFSNSAPMH